MSVKMRQELERLIINYGMKDLLTELIGIADDYRNEFPKIKYLDRFTINLQKAYSNYARRYDDE